MYYILYIILYIYRYRYYIYIIIYYIYIIYIKLCYIYIYIINIILYYIYIHTLYIYIQGIQPYPHSSWGKHQDLNHFWAFKEPSSSHPNFRLSVHLWDLVRKVIGGLTHPPNIGPLKPCVSWLQDPSGVCALQNLSSGSSHSNINNKTISIYIYFFKREYNLNPLKSSLVMVDLSDLSYPNNPKNEMCKPSIRCRARSRSRPRCVRCTPRTAIRRPWPWPPPGLGHCGTKPGQKMSGESWIF